MSDETDGNIEPSPERAKGRDPATGRLLPGHGMAGKGNPHAKQIAQFRAAIYESVTKDDLVAIVRKAVDQAKRGDKAARDFLFDRAIGKATQVVEANVEGNAVLKTYLGIELDQV